jgi:glycosyltransferase involved in cell wall biosynthesis
MKVLWISHFIPYPPKAGVLIRGFSLLNQLKKKSQVDIFMFDQPRLRSTFYSSIEENLHALTDALGHEHHGRLYVHEIPSEQNKKNKLLLRARSTLSTRSYTELWLLSRLAEKNLKAILRETKYDLVHFDTISLHFLKKVIPENIPCVLDHHNIESHMMQRRANQEKNPLIKFLMKIEAAKLQKMEKLIACEYERHIVCSDQDKSRLQEITGVTRITTIPNSVILENKSKKLALSGNRILFIGGLSWYPNLQAVNFFLDHIKPELDSLGISYNIDFVGKDVPNSLRKKYGKDKKISFHGYVDDITRLYDNSSVYIAPILDGGGTKLKVLDAMANHTPLVTTTLGVEGIDVKDKQHCIIADSPQSFAKGIEMLLSNKHLSEKLANNASSLIKEKYDQNVVGKNLQDLYSRLARF